jgi:hypothetical protein
VHVLYGVWSAVALALFLASVKLVRVLSHSATDVAAADAK